MEKCREDGVFSKHNRREVQSCGTGWAAGEQEVSRMVHCWLNITGRGSLLSLSRGVGVKPHGTNTIPLMYSDVLYIVIIIKIWPATQPQGHSTIQRWEAQKNTDNLSSASSKVCFLTGVTSYTTDRLLFLPHSFFFLVICIRWNNELCSYFLSENT